MKILTGKVSKLLADGTAYITIGKAHTEVANVLEVAELEGVYEGQPIEVVIQPLQVLSAAAGRAVPRTSPKPNGSHSSTGPKVGVGVQTQSD
jgi:hypothetical protein